jgi:hypothetical protein
MVLISSPDWLKRTVTEQSRFCSSLASLKARTPKDHSPLTARVDLVQVVFSNPRIVATTVV